jgi:hypothetical protein
MEKLSLIRLPCRLTLLILDLYNHPPIVLQNGRLAEPLILNKILRSPPGKVVPYGKYAYHPSGYRCCCKNPN